MRTIALILAAMLSSTCAHYVPQTEASRARDLQGDLLIDVTLRHDLGFTERYVATYTVGRRCGHLVSSRRREHHSVLPLSSVDRLYRFAETVLLSASRDPADCSDCTHAVVVVRVGARVHSFTTPVYAESEAVPRLLRELQGWK